jgi:hypothetical protein
MYSDTSNFMPIPDSLSLNIAVRLGLHDPHPVHVNEEITTHFAYVLASESSVPDPPDRTTLTQRGVVAESDAATVVRITTEPGRDRGGIRQMVSRALCSLCRRCSCQTPADIRCQLQSHSHDPSREAQFSSPFFRIASSCPASSEPLS